MIVQCIALLAAAMFAGAAIYVSVVEQPARLKLADSPMLEQWKWSYGRASKMQAGLAMVAGILGLWVGIADGSTPWIVGGLLMLAPWPWTLLVMMPTNHRLKATPSDAPAPDTRALVERWGPPPPRPRRARHGGRARLSEPVLPLKRDERGQLNRFLRNARNLLAGAFSKVPNVVDG